MRGGPNHKGTFIPLAETSLCVCACMCMCVHVHVCACACGWMGAHAKGDLANAEPLVQLLAFDEVGG